MTTQLFFVSAVTTLILVLFASRFILRHLQPSRPVLAVHKNDDHDISRSSPEAAALSKSLASALPGSVILPLDTAAFQQSMNCYWAQQECEVIPACVVRPRHIQELCTAVTILKREYDERLSQAGEGKVEGIFAIRSGGHSPLSGAASINGGVVIDLSLFCEVTPSDDGSRVMIGAGAKWMDVSKVLDEKGLAVIGGRNSAVGVGGLTLGGGLSFFSPRLGLVCSNVVSYELVLASGRIATASASTNPDLWRALKGGSNNFGIVTRFTFRSFPCTRIWSGFLYMPAFQAGKILAAFHESVSRADPGDCSTPYDDHAAGPIASFSYVQALGIQVIAVNLVYTKAPKDETKWPAYWHSSPFRPLWRLWSTCKIRTLTSATDELNALNPPGRRQVFATTTIKNDAATITAAHAAYRDSIVALRRAAVKGLVWTLVLQPFLPFWARKGDPNPLGLHDDTTNEPLVIVSFTVNWDERKDDEFVETTTRRTVERIEAFAAAYGTGHRYRYLNYCAEWQNPFQGYGAENWRFLRETSRKYDPDGLFQRGCAGGFKLGLVDGRD